MIPSTSKRVPRQQVAQYEIPTTSPIAIGAITEKLEGHILQKLSTLLKILYVIQ